MPTWRQERETVHADVQCWGAMKALGSLPILSNARMYRKQMSLEKKKGKPTMLLTYGTQKCLKTANEQRKNGRIGEGALTTDVREHHGKQRKWSAKLHHKHT